MSKLIITSDVHGSYSAWLTILNLMDKGDSLAIAGDLFDTRYGNYSNTDFNPDSIKKELNSFQKPYYFVYGNCDVQSFFPGFDSHLHFEYELNKIFLYHGHMTSEFNLDTKVVIQGHTHLCSLTKKNDQIFMNPGSISCPRNGLYTYGVIEKNWAHLIELRSGEKLNSIKLG